MVSVRVPSVGPREEEERFFSPYLIRERVCSQSRCTICYDGISTGDRKSETLVTIVRGH